MEAINRAIETAADFGDFIKKLEKINDAQVAAVLREQAAAHGPDLTQAHNALLRSHGPAPRIDGESRTQRRARERAEKKAAMRAAKAAA